MDKKSVWITVLASLGLVVLSSFLFAASFPNLIFKNGLPFLAWFAYIPILTLIYKNGFLSCAGWGAVYGYAAYGLYNYWLSVFHPLAGIIVGVIFLIYLAIVFTLLKLADALFPKRS
ncbi:MAG: apolipoprotein N-acyltransferase, partial [Treponema sp.]|nr:apolipoprotein N-acyltransferase [Treponema sp.]